MLKKKHTQGTKMVKKLTNKLEIRAIVETTSKILARIGLWNSLVIPKAQTNHVPFKNKAPNTA